MLELELEVLVLPEVLPVARPVQLPPVARPLVPEVLPVVQQVELEWVAEHLIHQPRGLCLLSPRVQRVHQAPLELRTPAAVQLQLLLRKLPERLTGRDLALEPPSWGQPLGSRRWRRTMQLEAAASAWLATVRTAE